MTYEQQSLSEITERITARRYASLLGGDRRQSAQDILTGNTVRGTTLFSGVVGATVRLGSRDGRTGLYSTTSPDGSQRNARSVGFQGFAPNAIVPATVFDGAGGWLDW